MLFPLDVEDLSYLEDNNSDINYLKQRVKFLSTHLIRYKLLLNSYEKYFDYFNEINKNIASNNELLDLPEKIKSLNNIKTNIKVLKECEKSCFVSLEKLSENQLNENRFQPIHQKSNEIEIIGNSYQLSGEEDSDSNTENIDDFDYTNDLSDDETIDASLESILAERQEPIESEEIALNPNIDSNESLRDPLSDQNKKNYQDIEEEVQNESQIQIKNIRSLRKRKVTSISGESKDYDIEFDNNSENGIIQLEQINHALVDEDIHENTIQQNIESNLETESNVGQLFQCDRIGCDQFFTAQEALDLHISRLHRNVIKQHKTIDDSGLDCELNDPYEFLSVEECSENEMTSQKPNGRSKESNDKSIEMFDCLWSGCEKWFTSKRALNTHTTRKHKSVRKKSKATNDFEIDYHSNRSDSYVTVEEVSDNESLGSIHQTFRPRKAKRKTQTKPGFKCSWDGCDKWFTDKRGVKAHIYWKHNLNTVSNTEKKTKSKTNKSTDPFSGAKDLNSRQFELSSHEVDFHPELFSDLPFLKCHQNGCEFKTNNPKSFEYHTNTHNTRQHICNICQEAFPKFKLLKEHMTTHKNIGKFCGICQKTYTSLSGFIYHMKSLHLKGKLFICDVEGCHKSYMKELSLKKHQESYDHINTDTDENSYRCDWPGCRKSFCSKKSRAMHRSWHKKKQIIDDDDLNRKSKNISGKTLRIVKLDL